MQIYLDWILWKNLLLLSLDNYLHYNVELTPFTELSFPPTPALWIVFLMQFDSDTVNVKLSPLYKQSQLLLTPYFY